MIKHWGAAKPKKINIIFFGLAADAAKQKASSQIEKSR